MMVGKSSLQVALILILVLGYAEIPAQMYSSMPGQSLPVGIISRPSITADTAIVIDDTTRQILYAKDPHRRVAPASLTKMVTAMVALDRGKLTDRVQSDVNSQSLAAETDSSVMGLMPGDVLTLEQLLYGLLLPSGNDAAIAIAEHIAGSESRFVAMMNDKANALGLKDTHFANPHGLDDYDHYTTVYDMAIIARAAMQYPSIAKIVSTKRVRLRFSETKQLDLYTGNPLIGEYRGADGVKPGYTDEAQQAIAATAKRGNRRLYVVLIRSKDIAKDATKLFDHYFPLTIWVPLRPPLLPE